MGVWSRSVVPVCAELCCCMCPQLRSRSRKPIKRYKQFLEAIFKSAEEGTINDKQIGKLAEYAFENPERIPVISQKLTDRAARDVPAGHYVPAAAVTKSFSKLASTCGSHMPLIAAPVLSLAQKLLESKSASFRCLGCQATLDFIDAQGDTAFGSQIDALILSILSVAKEPNSSNSKEPQAPGTRAAALAALRAYITYAAKFGRVLPSTTWEQVVGAVLDAYSRGTPPDTPAAEINPAEGGTTGAGSDGTAAAGAAASSPEAAARAVMQRAIEEARSKAGRTNGAPVLPEMSRELLQSPEASALSCVWTLALISQSSAGSTLFPTVLSPVLAYVSNGSLWAPASAPAPATPVSVTGQGWGVTVLSDLRDALRLVGAQQAHERQEEFNLIQAMLALIAEGAEATSPVPQKSQADALSALLFFLQSTRASPVPHTQTSSPASTLSSNQEGTRPRGGILMRLTTSSGYAIAEVLCVESLAKFLARALKSSSSGEGKSPLVLAVQACVAELARLIGQRSEFLDALGASVEGIPSTEARETQCALEAVALLAPGGLEKVEGGEGAQDEGREACPQLLFNAVLQVSSHPDVQVRQAGQKLLLSLLSQHPGHPAPFLALSETQAHLLLSSVWLTLAHNADSLTPACFASLHGRFLLALGGGVQEGSSNALFVEASQLALALRSKAATSHEALLNGSAPASAMQRPLNPSTRRSLLSLSSAMIRCLLLKQRNDGSTSTSTESVMPLFEEMLPKDPFLTVGKDGGLVESQPGSPGYASPEDKANAAEELASLQPKERRLQAQLKFGVALAQAAASLAGASRKQEQVLEDLRAEFSPDQALAVLLSSYLSANELPPSASPSALLPGVSSPGQADPEAQVAASLGETVEDAAPSGGYGYGISGGGEQSSGLPGVDELISSLAGSEAQSGGEEGSDAKEQVTHMEEGSGGSESVSQALAILQAIA